MLSIFFEGLVTLLRHVLQSRAIWRQFSIVLIMFQEFFGKIPLILNVALFQLHVPLQRCHTEAILELVNEELVIINVRLHLVIVRSQVSIGTTNPFVLIKVMDFELFRDDYPPEPCTCL